MHAFDNALTMNVTKGMNILSVDLTEIMVTVGGQPCVIDTDLTMANVRTILSLMRYLFSATLPSGTLLHSS